MKSPSLKDELKNLLVSITYSRLFARELGITEATSEQFLKGTGISHSQLLTLDGHISFEEQALLIRNAIAISGNPALGLIMGPKLHIATHGSLGVALVSSHDLETMLNAYVKYSSVRVQFALANLETTDEHYIVEIVDFPAMGEIHNFFYDLMFSILQHIVEEIIGEPLTDGQFCCAHATPDYVEKYREALHSPVQFDCDRYLYFVPRRLGKIPSPLADQHLYSHALLLCEEKLREMRSNDRVVNQIQMLLFDNPGRIWTLDDVAVALKSSARTIMRKLKIEGTSYQEVQDVVHKEMVERYLLHKSLSSERIAYLLGYSDVSSFRRSFKRWFGVPPSQCRHLKE
jgi:AraC-like DNA-binding protein